ncbi:MAG: acyl-CoA dehydrogenase family protein, partial [Pseudomonadota bacterium]
MMTVDLDLTRDQRLLRDSIIDFIKKECEDDFIRGLDDEAGFPHSLYQKMTELGWMGLSVPERYGGFYEGSLTDVVVLVEELSRCMAALGVLYVDLVHIPSVALSMSGSETQRAHYLPGIMDGKIKISCAISEPGVGMDETAFTTQGRPKGGGFSVTGIKRPVFWGDPSSHVLGISRVQGDTLQDGILCFIAPLDDVGLVRKEELLGLKSAGASQIVFSEFMVGPDHILNG